MKKTMITAIMLAAAIATMLASCGTKTECDFCGEEKICETREIMDETIAICNDCMEKMNGEEDDDDNYSDVEFVDVLDGDDYDNDSNNIFDMGEETWNDENDENEEYEEHDESLDEETAQEEESNLIEIDIFEDVESFISYKGGNGHGYIDAIDVPDDYVKQIGDLYFSSDDYGNMQIIHNNECILTYGFVNENASDRNLSKGDTVKIKRTYLYDSDLEKLANLGYKIKNDSTVVTVPDFGDYITEKSQITPEVYEAIKTKLEENREPDEFCELYFTTYKPHVVCNRTTNCFVTAVVYHDGFSYDYYVDEVYEIILKPDGSITCNISNEGGDKTIEKAREKLNTSKYNFELIKHND